MEETENTFTCPEEGEFARHLVNVCYFNGVPKGVVEELRDLFLKFRNAHRQLILNEISK